jgi:uncharacterized protein YjaZ
MKLQIFPVYKEYKLLENNSRKEIERMVKSKVKRTTDGYAGFRKISYLVDYVWQQEAKVEDLKRISEKLNESRIEKRILILSKKCNKVLPTSELNAFIFPFAKTRKSVKVINDLCGVTAYTPWQKNFLLQIHPQKEWIKYLDMTIVHEFNHSVRMQYFTTKNKEWTILDCIVLEGLADNFVRQITGFIPTWARPFPKNIEQKIFKQIEEKIHQKVTYYDFHEKIGIMFGNKEFPQWSGYRIGYSIVNNFLLENSKTTFQELIKLDANEILERSCYVRI